MATKLIRSALWYNPFILEDVCELDRIVVYEDGKELFSFRWFGSSNSYQSITFPFDVKRAVKLNLERTDAFYIKNELYIHASLIDCEFNGRKENIHETWYSVASCDEYVVRVNGVKIMYSYNGDERQERREAGTFTEIVRCNYNSVETPEYTRCKKLSKLFKEKACVDIPAYNIHDILEVANISIKRAK